MRINRDVIALMNLAAERAFVVNVFNIIGKSANYRPVSFQMMWKKDMTVLSKTLSEPIKKEAGRGEYKNII